MEPSVDDEEMTRLLSYRVHHDAPVSSRKPSPWPMAPVMTVEVDSRARVAPLPPPPSARSLAPTHVTSTGPDSLRPVAFAPGDRSSDVPAPTAITMQTRAIEGRPTAAWAAALVVLGAFIGLGTAAFGRGNPSGLASTAATWFHGATTSTASQPVEDSFAKPPEAPRTPPPPVVAAASPPPAPSVIERPAAERAADHPSSVASPPSDPVAALTGGSAESAKAPPSRPTYVAPAGYSHFSHHSSKPHVSLEPSAPTPPLPAPLAALVPAADDSASSKSVAPSSAPKTAKTHGKKATEDDLSAASASDALARAQLEAALR
jgi:hypothetical protein